MVDEERYSVTIRGVDEETIHERFRDTLAAFRDEEEIYDVTIEHITDGERDISEIQSLLESIDDGELASLQEAINRYVEE